MNYKVGDSVVCIDAMGNGFHTGLTAGDEYVVARVTTNECCGLVVVDVSIKKRSTMSICICGKIRREDGYSGAWRFIKLPEVTARTEVTSEAEAI